MSDGPDKEKGVIKSKQMVSQPTSRQPDPETVPDLDYEPTRDELTEEMDMPGLDLDTVRKTVFRPLKRKDKAS